jgi:hypothetical protein
MLHIELCWVCDENPPVTTHQGRKLCADCLEHFTEPNRERAEYPDAATVRDIRFGVSA